MSNSDDLRYGALRTYRRSQPRLLLPPLRLRGPASGGRLCERCTLSDRLTALLNEGTGRIYPQLVPLHQLLVRRIRLESRLIWLRDPQVPALLRDLATGTVPHTRRHPELAELADRGLSPRPAHGQWSPAAPRPRRLDQRSAVSDCFTPTKATPPFYMRHVHTGNDASTRRIDQGVHPIPGARGIPERYNPRPLTESAPHRPAHMHHDVTSNTSLRMTLRCHTPQAGTPPGDTSLPTSDTHLKSATANGRAA